MTRSWFTALAVVTCLLVTGCGNDEANTYPITPEQAQVKAEFFMEAFHALQSTPNAAMKLRTARDANEAAGLTLDSLGVFVEFQPQSLNGPLHLCMQFPHRIFVSMTGALGVDTWVQYNENKCVYRDPEEEETTAFVSGSLSGGADLNPTQASLGAWDKGAVLMGDWLPGNIVKGFAPGEPYRTDGQRYTTNLATAQYGANLIATEVVSLLSRYASVGSGDLSMEFTKPVEGATTMTITMGKNPSPLTPKTLRYSFQVNPAVSRVSGFIAPATGTGTGGAQFCVMVEVQSAVGVATDAGTQPYATACATSGPNLGLVEN